jgi:hypothetical protein
MTNPDFRALCAELLAALEIQLDELRFNNRLCLRARAALAQPKPVAPTDEELWSAGNDDFRANCYPTDAIYFARAVLARWGQP